MKTFTSLALSAVLITSAAHGQYCMLPGRTPYSAIQPGITNFKLSTLNRTSAAVESFSTVVVETGDTTILLRGHTYTVTMTHTRDSVNFPTVRNNIRVWIDYNNNTSYDDAGETVISADYQTYGVFTGTFTVPTTAPLGTTRLRATVKMSSDGGHTLPTSCDMPADPIGYHGEMEDYVVKIQGTTGIENVNGHDSKVSIFPNPTSNHLTLAFEEAHSGSVTVSLYDVTGKLAATLLNKQPQYNLEYNFDLGNYVSAPGMYIMKIETENGTSYQRVIKN